MFDAILNRPIRLEEFPDDLLGDIHFMELLHEMIEDGDVRQVDIDGVPHYQLTEKGMTLAEDPDIVP